MKVRAEGIENRQAVLRIEVEPEDMEESLEAAYHRLVDRVNVPGFRRGKAPRIVLERYMGKEALREEAMGQLVPQVCDQAIQEQNMEAFAPPQVEILETDPAVLKVIVSLPPIIELGDYHKICLVPQPAEIGEDEVNAVIDELRSRHAWWEPVERPASQEDLVTIELEERQEGGPVLERQEQQYLLAPGYPFPLPGFVEQVIGMEKGEEKEFTLSYPPDFRVEELANKQCYFKVKLVEVKGKLLPVPGDEFAKSIGEDLETMDALQDRITTNLTVLAQRRAQRDFEQKVVQAVADLAKVEFPPVLIEREVENFLAELASEYSQDERGVENYLKSIGKTEADLREEMRPSAIKRLTQSLVLGKVAEEEKIEVSPAEIETGIDEVVQNAGERVEEWRGIFSSPPGRRWIERRLLMRKTVERIVEIAQSSTSEENENF